ncbi:hypothetical protein [Bradyrhizobium sp.]|uniref:hypothetical protein n=1 Tax=Bradyrhizobium sp. TaxID=376 RepID=UPI0027267E18|nr:hypothetical protein [Bradyrhizobium sp.]MDO9296849.1 hypothetical protein [Bradyrhizobium sp.]
MAKRSKSLGDDERLKAFASRLNRLMLAKGVSGADLAREASKFVPKGGKALGRHLISAYSRAANEPTEVNLQYISKALGVKPEELLPPMPGEGESPQYATATSTLDGKTRLVVDAEVDAEVALKILGMVRGALPGKSRSAA